MNLIMLINPVLAMWTARLPRMIAPALFIIGFAHSQGHAQPAPDQMDGVARYEGVVVPGRQAEIAPRAEGVLQAIHFRAGQFVKENDLLVEFISTEKELQLEIERARLSRAEAKLILAEAELANKQKLHSKNAAPEYQLLRARVARDVAVADVAEARSLVRMAEMTLKDLKLYAPFDGIMSEPLFPQGTFLKRELQSELARIIQLDPIRVAAEVPFDVYYNRRLLLQTDRKMLESVELSLILPNGVAYPHKGHLTSGGYKFAVKAQKIQVWAEFPNPEHLLRPGLKVQIESRPIKTP